MSGALKTADARGVAHHPRLSVSLSLFLSLFLSLCVPVSPRTLCLYIYIYIYVFISLSLYVSLYTRALAFQRGGGVAPSSTFLPFYETTVVVVVVLVLVLVDSLLERWG